jgi:hypothetical protein
MSTSEQRVESLEMAAGGFGQGSALSMQLCPRPNGHTGPWECGFLQKYVHNAA